MKIRLYTGNDTTSNRIVAGITLKDKKNQKAAIWHSMLAWIPPMSWQIEES